MVWFAAATTQIRATKKVCFPKVSAMLVRNLYLRFCHNFVRGYDFRFGPGHVTVDLWPDVSEYDDDELCETPFYHTEGTRAQVFSSHNRKTVIRHFQAIR